MRNRQPPAPQCAMKAGEKVKSERLVDALGYIGPWKMGVREGAVTKVSVCVCIYVCVCVCVCV